MNPEEQGGNSGAESEVVAKIVHDIVVEDLQKIREDPEHPMRISAAMLSALTQRYGNMRLSEDNNDELLSALRLRTDVDTGPDSQTEAQQ